MFFPLSLSARYKVNAYSNEGFFGAYRLAGRYYPDTELKNANEYIHELSFGSEYRRRDDDAGRERELYSAFTIAQHDGTYYDPDDGGSRQSGGIDIGDRMNYLRYGPELVFRQSLGRLSFSAMTKAQLWNYENVAPVPEYDHEFFFLGVTTQYRFGPTSLLRLSLNKYSRRFGDRPSFELDGTQPIGTPPVRYDYFDASLIARQRLFEGFWFGVEYERTRRLDRHVGYNDYVRDSYGVEIHWDIGNRFGYEKAGALRDVMQNHMLQLLAVTAMEPPNSLDPEAVRTEKLKTLHAIRLPDSAEEVEACTVRGQYGPGSINGEKVPGYRQEAGVAADSSTPTFVAARLYLDTWRWAGVPFLLRHGKRMAKRATEIAVQFRTPPLALFRGTDIPGRCTNLLMIRIQPDEGISLRFGAKQPGVGMHIANVQMDFGYEESFNARIPDAYERLLIDALTGDPTLFTRSDEVRAMWRWADAVQEGWEAIGPPRYPNYAAGSWGPPEAERLFSSEEAARLGFCLIGWRQP